MSRKFCRRRHYALVSPIDMAISGATITTEEDLDKIRMRELTAIDNFGTGKATPSDFRDVCDMLNLAQTMAEMGIGPEVLRVCTYVERTLLACKDEWDADGRMDVDEFEMAGLRDLYEYHDLQRTSVDRRAYEQAIARTRNKIRSAHPAVKVLA